MLPTLLLTLALAEEPRCPAGTKLIKRDQVEQCVTPQGKVNGVVRVKSDSGKVILEQQWVNDQLDGPGHTWHDNGKMESETFYKAGKHDIAELDRLLSRLEARLRESGEGRRLAVA